MTDFVVIDFETANERRGSPCSVGYACVEGLQVVDSGSFLIRPPEFRFNTFNVMLNGITPEMCETATEWKEAITQLEMLIGGSLVVAHYTPFDIGVIRDACAYTATACPELHFACTRQVARLVWPELGSYCLPDVVAAAGGRLEHHHQAEADAVAAASVAIAAARLHDCSSFLDLLDQLQIYRGTLLSGLYTRSGTPDPHRLPRVPSDGVVLDPDHPFCGRRLVFTGGLMSMARHDAQQAVVDVGGRAMTSVGKQTDYVVVGGEFHGLLAGHEHSHKWERALEMRALGAPLELLNEVEFLALLRGGA